MGLPDVVLFSDDLRGRAHRVATIENGDMSGLESQWPIDSIELVVPTLSALRTAYAEVRAALAQINQRYRTVPILVRAFACIDETVSQAAARFDATIGRHSAQHLNNIWYVGTTTGLQGLLEDVASLQLCDGVVIHYLEATGSGRAGLG
jgi:hypothetical protein